MNELILIRGGGDLASGVAARLHRAGIQVLITELRQPLVVRRRVSFAEAVFSGSANVEEISARKVTEAAQIAEAFRIGVIPVLVDPDLNVLAEITPLVVVDGRMIKQPVQDNPQDVPLLIGLGPGFTAGTDCDAVVETMRGHLLGRVVWQGSACPNTGVPETVGGRDEQRVLRAPASGVLISHVSITEQIKEGDLVAEVEGAPVLAPFDGVVRGLLHEGLSVSVGMKIGDLDPRNDPSYCTLISDKALAVGGGVLEAVVSKPEIRAALFGGLSRAG